MQAQLYDSGIVSSLLPFEFARRRFDAVRESLDDIGDAICELSLHQEAGINLLHRHFEIEPGEALIKRFLPRENMSTLEPVVFSSSGTLVPYLWQFKRRGTGEWTMFPLEFVDDVTGDYGRKAAALLGKGERLNVLADRIEKIGLIDVFGITLPDDDVLITEGEIRVEDSDPSSSRKLRVTAGPRSLANDSEISEVTWFFTPAADEEATQLCGFHCKQHCKSHCKKHCKDHA